MTAVGLLHAVDGERADGVDGELVVDIRGAGGHGDSCGPRGGSYDTGTFPRRTLTTSARQEPESSV